MKGSSLCLLIVLVFFSCKKDDDSPLEDNIYLVDKPLKTIKRYAEGRFELKYIRYGIAPQFKAEQHDRYIDILKDSIIWSSPGGTWRSAISWKAHVNARNISTYIMEFYAVNNVPDGLMVESMTDGMLILVEDGPDASGFYLKRRP